jgi:hypothetical protein
MFWAPKKTFLALFEKLYFMFIFLCDNFPMELSILNHCGGGEREILLYFLLQVARLFRVL